MDSYLDIVEWGMNSLTVLAFVLFIVAMGTWVANPGKTYTHQLLKQIISRKRVADTTDKSTDSGTGS